MSPLLFACFFSYVFSQQSFVAPASSGTSQGTGTFWLAAGAVTVFNDGNYASSTLVTGSQNSSQLYVTFNFASLPLDAIIHGLRLSVTRTYTVTMIVDTLIQLWNAGAVYGNPRSNVNWLGPSAFNTVNYGGTFDTWGATLDVSVLKSGTFGVVMKALCPGGCSGSPQARVDYVEMTAFWSSPSFPITTNSISTQEITTNEITSSPLTTSPLTTSPLTSSRLTTSPVTTNRLTTSPLTTAAVTTSPLTSSRLTTSPLTTATTTSPLTTSPVTTNRLTTSPLTTAAVTTSPLTTAVTTSPLTTAAVTTSPLTTATTTSPLTTSPVTTNRLTSSPSTTAAVTTSPLTSSPLTSSSLTSSPLTTFPLTSSLLTTAPLTSSPALVTTSPLLVTPTTQELTSGAISLTTSKDDSVVGEGVGIQPGAVVGISVGVTFGLVALLGKIFLSHDKTGASLLIVFFIRKRKVSEKEENIEELKETQTEESSKYVAIPTAIETERKDESVKTNYSPLENMNEPKWIIKYEELTVLEAVGEGSFGVVYKAEWRNAPVAVKQLKNVADKEMEAFIAEVNLQSRLRSHPNILQFHGACVDITKPLCLVTDFMANGNLRSYLDKNLNIAMDKKMTWIKGIAAGMNHLGQEGIVHRDLAARNILLSTDYTVKISDFGMSRFAGRNSALQTRSEVGPLKWMSPENLILKEYSTMSDCWSFGVVIFEIITQQEPYPGLEPAQAATQLIAKMVSLTLPKGTNSTLQKVFEGCMSWEPKSRPDFAKICKMLS